MYATSPQIVSPFQRHMQLAVTEGISERELSLLGFVLGDVVFWETNA